MSFPKIGLAHDPILYKKLKDTSSHDVLNSYGWVFQISDYTGKIEISKKNWTSFPVIGLAHDQKIEISKKWMIYPEIGLSQQWWTHHHKN